MANVRTGTDHWSLFLRQMRLKDQICRLRSDLRDCHCPPGCRGGLQNHVDCDPASLPPNVVAPYVREDSDMPITRNRTEERRDPQTTVVAEARGTSDILLRRSGARATLRMSLQVHTDPTGAGRVGYYAEMFLTQPGAEEEFIGLINTWFVDQRNRDWERIYLTSDSREWSGDMGEMRIIVQYLHGQHDDNDDPRPRDSAGRPLPIASIREQFAAPWAMLSGETDILYIPLIWIADSYTGQRIIDQGFELFFRLAMGRTLAEPYNLTRPLSALLVPGPLHGEGFESNWNDPSGRGRMDMYTRVGVIASAYRRNGFMRLTNDYSAMARRVEPADHPARPGDVNIGSQQPPETDLNTQSPRWGKPIDLLRSLFLEQQQEEEEDDDDDDSEDGEGELGRPLS